MRFKSQNGTQRCCHRAAGFRCRDQTVGYWHAHTVLHAQLGQKSNQRVLIYHVGGFLQHSVQSLKHPIPGQLVQLRRIVEGFGKAPHNHRPISHEQFELFGKHVRVKQVRGAQPSNRLRGSSTVSIVFSPAGVPQGRIYRLTRYALGAFKSIQKKPNLRAVRVVHPSDKAHMCVRREGV